MREKMKGLLPRAPYSCVTDLEATCCDQEQQPPAFPKEEMETIEIGAVMVDGETLVPLDEFQAFVRPVRHPRLDPFCTALTTIRQDDVDQAGTFPEVFTAFLVWAGQYPLWRFSSWGAYDVKQLRRDGAFWNLSETWSWEEAINLKRLFARQRGIKECGIPAALSIAGLSPMTGIHHRGIDDARNIARLLPLLFRDPSSAACGKEF